MPVVPRSTYRVQLHEGFTFDDAAAVLDYLAELGVSHLYCSPYFQAAPHSTHGYDVVDPQHVNGELGGPEGLGRLVTALRAHALGQVLDIVPNHMAADPSTNHWWWDVLESGPLSPYARFFDIDWAAGNFAVLVPILADHYGRVLEAGELWIAPDWRGFVLHYSEHALPVSLATLDDLLARAAKRAESEELSAVAEGVRSLQVIPAAEHHAAKHALTRRLVELSERDPAVRDALVDEVAALNRDVESLDLVLRRQNYRVAFWRTASEELDYRRFFNIESLVGVRVEDPEVFAETHELVLQLVADGTVDGLRIDHVDGLAEPARYLRDLAGAASGVWTVVEKILEPEESLPDWPVAGTSGYDFLNRVNEAFVDSANEDAMTSLYRDFSGEQAPYEQVVHDSKLQILRNELAAELDRLVGLLARICDRYRRQRDHTRRELARSLCELVAHLGVYRTYVARESETSSTDRRNLRHMVAAAHACCPDLDGELLAFVAELAEGTRSDPDEVQFVLRFQQLSSAVMAKGAEDTAFYRYHRLVSLNEVGGDPATFGRPVAAFHHDTVKAAAHWPESMLTLSTHDTKRSADVRARLNVLSEMPDVWRQAVQLWSEHNARHRRDGWSDPNAEYLLYQTVVGAWPLGVDRAVAFMQKATREAKVHTSWTSPDPVYDDAVDAFVRGVLGDETFLLDVEEFLADTELVGRGRENSLSQTALLLTCPGVPDLYQGTELWDSSLVDPDNRRPVDYDERRRVLASLRGADVARAVAQSSAGGPKLWMTQRLLADRRLHEDRYAAPRYEPLTVGGEAPGSVVAYTRGELVVVAPCRTSKEWRPHTTVELPGGAWSDILTGARFDGGHRSAEELLALFPVAVLERQGS